MQIIEDISIFVKKVAEYISKEKEIILEMNGVILQKSGDTFFDFKSAVIEEVRDYCREQGINKVDRVVIISAYDGDIHNLEREITFDQTTVSKNDSRIVVVKDNDKVIAQVFFREYLQIQGDN